MEYVTRVDAHSMDLRGATAQPCPADFVGGLLAGLPQGEPRIVTGIAAGPVRVKVQRQETAPAAVATEWEDIVEVSCMAVEADVVAAGQYDAAPDPQFALNPPGATWFRLRVHARGRDLEYDGVATDPREEYLLVAWPADPSTPTVLGDASRTARQFMAAPGRPLSTGSPTGARVTHRGESTADAQRRAQAQANLLRIDRRER